MNSARFGVDPAGCILCHKRDTTGVRLKLVISIMVALVVGGVTTGIWMYRPAHITPPVPADWAHLPPALRAAVEECVSACRAHPDDHTAWSRLGQLYHAHHENTLAAACYHQALALQHDARTAYLLGLLCVESGDSTRAIALLEKAARAHPDYAPVHYHLGIALLDAGSIAPAIEALRVGVRCNPQDPTLRAGLGRALRHAGRLDDAEATLRAALVIDADHYAANQLLGLVLLARGTASAAQPHLAAVKKYNTEVIADPWLAEVQAQSTTLSATVARARAQLIAGRPDGARLSLESARVEHPNNPEIHRLLGDACLQMNDLPAAEQAYAIARDLEPHDHRPQAALASALFKRGATERAEALADDVLRAVPEHAGMLTIKGVQCSRRNEDDAALAYLTRAIAANDTETAAYATLGDVLVRRGRLDDARQAYARAAELQPGWAYPRQRLEQLAGGSTP